MKRFLTFSIVVAVLAGGFFFYRQYQAGRQAAQTLASLQTEVAARGPLTATVGATGVVRSNQSAVLTWQTSGTVGQVFVQAGDRATAGQVLAEIEQTSLPQQIILAQADLVSAQRALDDLMNSGLQPARALQAVEDAQQALDDLLNPELQQALALQKIADAKKTVELAERRLSNLRSIAGQADIDAAKAQVVLAQSALDRAKDQFEPYANKPEDNLTRANLQARLSSAQQAYDLAVRQLNALQGTGSELDIAVAQAGLATAQAQLTEANRAWERVKDGPSAAQVALLQAQLADAQREYARLKDGPDPDDLAAAQARVAATEATLNQAHITAPFAGMITSLAVKPGDLVNPGSVAFQVDDLSHLLVDVDVSEVDINRIQVGQDVTLTFDAVLAREYSGKVQEVALVGTTVQGLVSFVVTVELSDADENVRSGMTAGVNIVVSKLESVLLVPNRAVRVRNGRRVVYVLVSGDPVPQPVNIELGSSSDLYSEVVGGDLKEGDTLVLNPPAESFFFAGGPPGQNGP